MPESVPSPAGAGGQPTLGRALRRDPGHAHELVLSSVLPSLAAHAVSWHAKVSAHPDHRPDKVAAAVKRRTVVIARRDGAFTGTSFYFGMPAAMMSIYCHQVLLVLKLAALRGLDPRDPARAAEILVLRGRYPDVAAATTALGALGSPGQGTERPPRREMVARAVRSLPAQVRVAASKLRHGRPVDTVLTLLQYASYLVPFLSVPVWAASYARTTRQLGRKADALYGAPPATAHDPLPEHWGVAPLALGRTLAVAVAAFGAATAGLLAHGLSVRHHHAIWYGLAGGCFFVTVTQVRLWRILRTGG